MPKKLVAMCTHTVVLHVEAVGTDVEVDVVWEVRVIAPRELSARVMLVRERD
jgi:hypothetical protein